MDTPCLCLYVCVSEMDAPWCVNGDNEKMDAPWFMYEKRECFLCVKDKMNAP